MELSNEWEFKKRSVDVQRRFQGALLFWGPRGMKFDMKAARSFVGLRSFPPSETEIEDYVCQLEPIDSGIWAGIFKKKVALALEVKLLKESRSHHAKALGNHLEAYQQYAERLAALDYHTILRQWMDNSNSRAERERTKIQAMPSWQERFGAELYYRQTAYTRQYRYHALTTDTGFRLLKLHSRYHSTNTSVRPSNDQESSATHKGSPYLDELICSLHAFDLLPGEHPPFEALSYEWNGDHPNATTSKNEAYLLMREDTNDNLRSVRIGRNLFNFLECIRSAKNDIWVWVDAVCINQSKPEERARQVKLMGQIYSRARTVLAWLPVSDPITALDSLEILRSSTCKAALEFYARGRECRNFGNSDVDTIVSDTGVFDWQFDILDCDILTSTFWTRKWIIQEIILAKSVLLVVGGPVFPMKDLEDILARLEEAHTSRHRRTDAAVSHWPVAKLAAHRRKRRIGMTYPHTLHQLLPLYAENQCKEPLDHVYALYHLIGQNKEFLPVDYEQSKFNWFMETLKFLDRHEPLAKTTLIESAFLLSKMTSRPNFFSMGLSSEDLATLVTVSVFDQGSLVLEQESSYSNMLRKHVKSLHPQIRWTLKPSKGLWMVDQKEQVFTKRCNTRELGYFKITGKQVCGLAATSIRQGDRVWQFPNQPLALIVRVQPGVQIRILGRCYLFNMWNNGPARWATCSMLSVVQARQRGESMQCYDLRLSLADMFRLGMAMRLPTMSVKRATPLILQMPRKIKTTKMAKTKVIFSFVTPSCADAGGT